MRYSIVLSAQPAAFQAATFKGDLPANLRTIASLGYDGVELAIRDPQQVDLDAIERMVQEAGLVVSAIGTGQAWGEENLSFTDPDASIRKAAVDRLLSHVPGARRFGAVLVVGLLRGVLRPGVKHEQAMDWLIQALRECCQAAREQGVRLALEPINRYETSLVNTATEGLRLLERVGAENFGLLLDTFHMNIEEPRIEASIRECGRKIFHFHVADSNRRHPGGGHLDFGSILASLAATGYTGWVSGEFLPLPDAESAARLGLEHLRTLPQNS